MKDTFKTVAKFQYSAEAQIIKGRLEADGIRVFLADNITIDTDPLVSNAIGGIKLKVPSYQFEEAQTILESIQKYSIDDEGNAVTCPNCSGQQIQLFSTIKDLKSFLSFCLSFLLNFFTYTLPLFTRYRYRCETCKTEFDLK